MAEYKQREALRETKKGLPKTLRISGKQYEIHSYPFTKKGALKDAEKLRHEGYHARVLKYKNQYGWDIGYVVYKKKIVTKSSPIIERRVEVRRSKTPRITPKTPRLKR